MADAPLSEAGEAQLLEVARSLQRRRRRAVAEVVSEFKEAKEDRLTEELYTHEDAERLLDGLLGLVRTSVKNDVRASEHSTLLLLNDALAQAARGGAGVAVDPARCADRALLQAVDQWETRDGAQPLRQRMAEKKAAFVAPSQRAPPARRSARTPARDGRAFCSHHNRRRPHSHPPPRPPQAPRTPQLTTTTIVLADGRGAGPRPRRRLAVRTRRERLPHVRVPFLADGDGERIEGERRHVTPYLTPRISRYR